MHANIAAPAVSSARANVQSKTTALALQIAAALCVLLILVRIVNTFSFVTPLHFTTTGYEQEALFSLWKWGNHQPVYSNVFALPFSASYFNYLFYDVYGAIIWPVLRGLHLSADWLPTIARLITLAFGVGSAGCIYLLLNEQAAWGVRFSPRTRLTLAIIAAFNPLFSWWMLTARPDVPGCFFELVALVLLVRFTQNATLPRLVTIVVCCYAAWSFKQVNIAVFAGLLWWLWQTRQTRFLFFAFALFAGLVGATFAAHDRNYFYCVALSQRHMGFSPLVAIHNFLSAVLKFPFLLAAVGFGVWEVVSFFRRKKASPFLRCVAPPEHPAIGLLFVVFVFSLVWFLLAAGKVGAAGNYFFLPGVTGFLWTVLWYGSHGSNVLRRDYAGASQAAALLLSLAIVLTLVSNTGLIPKKVFNALGFPADISQRRYHDAYVRLQNNLRDLPGPVFVLDGYANEPWIQPHAPHIILACAYFFDREAGATFEGGGVGGLISTGYFGTVVVPPGETLDQVDKANPSHYRLLRRDADFAYYTRFPR